MCSAPSGTKELAVWASNGAANSVSESGSLSQSRVHPPCPPPPYKLGGAACVFSPVMERLTGLRQRVRGGLICGSRGTSDVGHVFVCSWLLTRAAPSRSVLGKMAAVSPRKPVSHLRPTEEGPPRPCCGQWRGPVVFLCPLPLPLLGRNFSPLPPETPESPPGTAGAGRARPLVGSPLRSP